MNPFQRWRDLVSGKQKEKKKKRKKHLQGLRTQVALSNISGITVPSLPSGIDFSCFLYSDKDANIYWALSYLPNTMLDTMPCLAHSQPEATGSCQAALVCLHLQQCRTRVRMSNLTFIWWQVGPRIESSDFLRCKHVHREEGTERASKKCTCEGARTKWGTKEGTRVPASFLGAAIICICVRALGHGSAENMEKREDRWGWGEVEMQDRTPSLVLNVPIRTTWQTYLKCRFPAPTHLYWNWTSWAGILGFAVLKRLWVVSCVKKYNTQYT